MRLRLIFRFILFFTLASHYCFGQTSPHGEIRFKCAVCHSSESWKMRTDTIFDHSVTGFTLTGQHQKVACTSCHESLVFGKQSQDCLSCHTDIHKSELGKNCLRCHSTESWVISDMRERHQQTRFPLQGKHLITNCEVCHNRQAPNRYAGTPLECISCHRPEYLATTAPPHAQSGMGTDCSQCHLTTSLSWPGKFDHNLTHFDLTGAHVALECSNTKCHGGPAGYSLKYTDCYQCHADKFIAQKDPDHVATGFSHDCANSGCHNTTSWSGGRFDHVSMGKGYALVGAHVAATCAQCHKGNYSTVTYGGPDYCYTCHNDKFNTQTEPNHATANFNHDCTNSGCHSSTITTWTGGNFNHVTLGKGYALIGSHVAATCAQCHKGNYSTLTYGAPDYCYTCHNDKFNTQTEPNHATANFDHDCTSSGCHSSSITTWTGGNFNHVTMGKGYALIGSHVAATCAQCHKGNYSTLTYGPPDYCYSCHADKIDPAQLPDPNHITANFNHDCTNAGCHSASLSTFSGGQYSHPSAPLHLDGAHILPTTTCVQCHKGNYTSLGYNAPDYCYACHKDKYDAQTSPNHGTLGFPHDCTNSGCHNTTTFSGGNFNHPTAPLKLDGAHILSTTTCDMCHKGNYNTLTYGSPDYCYSCHKDRYDAQSNPNHGTLGFSHDCTNSGCHNTTTFSGGTFTHPTAPLKLDGAHILSTTTCDMCHKGNYNTLTYGGPDYCYTCHSDKFIPQTNPNHVAANFNHDCTNSGCHNTTTFTGGKYVHGTSFPATFPLDGAHTALSCNTPKCHGASNYSLVFAKNCYQCHSDRYNGADNHVSGNYSHYCLDCHNHTTTRWNN